MIEADCVVWNVDDEQTDVLLSTLNRLTGTDCASKKIELLTKLKQRMPSIELAKLLPQTAKQIEQLTNLKLKASTVKVNTASFVVPMVFFVTQEQNKIIEGALSKTTIQSDLTK